MKKIISIIISAIMLLSTLMPFTASADEEINLYETYTFEEFVNLSADEICGISEEIANEYTEYKDEVYKTLSHYSKIDTIWAMPGLQMNVTKEFSDEIETYYREHGDLLGEENVAAIFAIPDPIYSMVTSPYRYDVDFGSNYPREYFISFSLRTDRFTERDSYDIYDFTAKSAVWMAQHPSVMNIYFEYEVCTDSLSKIDFGDINLDGKVSILDIIMLSKYNVQSLSLNDSQLESADCNNDGEVNELDTYVLMQFLVDIIDTLPCV